MADPCNMSAGPPDWGNTSFNCCSDHTSHVSQSHLGTWLIPSCYTCMSVLICLANGLMLDCYRRCAAARTVTNFFIVQLSIADLSVGVMLPFLAVFYVVKRSQMMIHNDMLCVLNYTLFMPPASASVLALLALTYDRFKSVITPLDYPSHMTRRRAHLIVAFGVWTPALTLGKFILSFIVIEFVFISRL